ncbi:MAG: hypothetical protein AB1633_05800 [Elusimicrobiota bacterium]
MPEPYSTIIISKPIHKELKKIAIDEEKPLYHITEELFEEFVKDWKKKNGCK